FVITLANLELKSYDYGGKSRTEADIDEYCGVHVITKSKRIRLRAAASLVVPTLFLLVAAQSRAQTLPQLDIETDPLGHFATYQTGGATDESQNAFFQSLGTNGRTCATCHQPAQGFGQSLTGIQNTFNATNPPGTDPLFAAVDGADCIDQP